MALAKGTNSYATVAEADAYFADRLNASAWSALSTPTKEQSLITATGILDQNSWAGASVSSTQPLAFPRSGYYFDPRLGASVQLTTVTPTRVVYAVFELAMHLVNNPEVYASSTQIQDIKVGPIELTNISKLEKSPSVVRNLIRPLLVNSGSSVWWRAN